VVRIRQRVVTYIPYFVEEFVFKVVDALVVHSYVSKRVYNEGQVNNCSERHY